jgi:serine/threonine protein kinase/Tol biopolymer transport system component
MGEVYRAVDERLGRTVALKLLAAKVESSPDRQLRMLREAQAASALNHPGIVTIFDVGTSGDRPFMVMELVEGVRFTELASRDISADEALRLCADAAEAMQTAHERGILHRDLKSDNLMRSDEGRVKVLDFGLAKLLDPSVLDSTATRSGARSGSHRVSSSQAITAEALSPTMPPDALSATVPPEAVSPTLVPAAMSPTMAPEVEKTLSAEAAPSTRSPVAYDPTMSPGLEIGTPAAPEELTRVGEIIGTPAYMSPEQAAGEPLDRKSEIFSLGVVLYELLVGRRPFRGSTVSETLTLVQRCELVLPRQAAPDRDLPPGIDAVMERALAKDPGERFDSMAEFAQAMRGLLDRASSPRRRRIMVGGVGALAVAGAVTAAVLARGGGGDDRGARAPVARTKPGDLRPVSPRRLTMDPGCEEFPSFFPDGKSLVFDAVADGGYSLFSIDVVSGKRQRLTRSPGWDYKPAVSPDGSRVAFLRRLEDAPSAYVTAASPGSVPLLVAKGRLQPAWSPDGTQLWAGSAETLTRIDVATRKVTRRLRPPKGKLVLLLRELPDGRVVAVPYGADVGYVGLGVVLYEADAGPDDEPRWLWKQEVEQVLSIAPNGDAIAARRSKAMTIELWRVPLDGTAPTHISGGAVAPSAGIDFHIRAGRVAWSDCSSTQKLLLLSRNGDTYRQAALPGGRWSDFEPVSIPGTERAVILSDRSGSIQIWEVDVSGAAAPRAIPTPGHTPSALAVSPDGTRIAFAEEGKGVFLVPRAGGQVVTVQKGAGYWYPSFTPGGDGLIVQYEPDGSQPRVGRLPLKGGDIRWLLKRSAAEPTASPRGDRIAVVIQTDPKNEIGVPAIIDVATGKHRHAAKNLPPGWYHNLRFSPDGRTLLLLEAGKTLIEIDLASGEAHKRYRTGVNQFMGVTYVGDRVLAGMSVWNGDLWVGKLRDRAAR